MVPFALIAEWLGHGALHENPGLLLHGLDDMRIFHGIKLGQKKKLIRLIAGKTRKKGSIFEVAVEIRDGIKDNYELRGGWINGDIRGLWVCSSEGYGMIMDNGETWGFLSTNMFQ